MYVKFVKLMLYYGISNTTPAIAPPKKSFDSEIVIECLEDMKMLIAEMKQKFHDIDVLSYEKVRCNSVEAFDWLVGFVQQN